jgi:hypothetical protein
MGEPALRREISPDRNAADRRRTLLALGAGWLVPGLGHILLSRVQRGLLFGAIVWGSYTLGLAHDGRLALRDERQPFLTSLQVIANLGVGPADVVSRLALYGTPAYRLRLNQAGETADHAGEVFRERARSGVAIYGTAYLWTAGLMNLLLLFDIWDIGRRKKA